MDSISSENSIEYHIYIDSIQPDPHNEHNACQTDTNHTTVTITDVSGVDINDQQLTMTLTEQLFALRASFFAYLFPMLSAYHWNADSFNLSVWNPAAEHKLRLSQEHMKRNKHFSLADVVLHKTTQKLHSTDSMSVHSSESSTKQPDDQKTAQFKAFLQNQPASFCPSRLSDDILSPHVPSTTTDDLIPVIVEHPIHFANIPHLFGTISHQDGGHCDTLFLHYIFLYLSQRFNDISILITEQHQSPLLPSIIPFLPTSFHRSEDMLNRVWIRRGQVLIIPKGHYRHDTAISHAYKVIQQHSAGYLARTGKHRQVFETSSLSSALATIPTSTTTTTATTTTQQTSPSDKVMNTAFFYCEHSFPSHLTPQLALYYIIHHTNMCYISHYHSRLLLHSIRLYPTMLLTNAVTIQLLLPLSVAIVLTHGELTRLALSWKNKTFSLQSARNASGAAAKTISLSIPSIETPLESSTHIAQWLVSQVISFYRHHVDKKQQEDTLMVPQADQIGGAQQRPFEHQVSQFYHFLQGYSIYHMQDDKEQPSSQQQQQQQSQNRNSSTSQSGNTSSPENQYSMPFILLPISLSQTQCSQLLSFDFEPCELYKTSLCKRMQYVLDNNVIIDDKLHGSYLHAMNTSQKQNIVGNQTHSVSSDDTKNAPITDIIPHEVQTALDTALFSTYPRITSFNTASIDISSLSTDAFIFGFRITYLLEYAYQTVANDVYARNMRYNALQNTIAIHPSSIASASLATKDSLSSLNTPSHGSTTIELADANDMNIHDQTISDISQHAEVIQIAQCLPDRIDDRRLLIFREMIRQRLYQPTFPTDIQSTQIHNDSNITVREDATDAAAAAALLQFPVIHEGFTSNQPHDELFLQYASPEAKSPSLSSSSSLSFNNSTTTTYQPLSAHPISFFAAPPIANSFLSLTDTQSLKENQQTCQIHISRRHSASAASSLYSYPNYLSSPSLRDVDQSVSLPQLLLLLTLPDPTPNTLESHALYRILNVQNDCTNLTQFHQKQTKQRLQQLQHPQHQQQFVPFLLPAIPGSKLHQSEQTCQTLFNFNATESAWVVESHTWQHDQYSPLHSIDNQNDLHKTETRQYTKSDSTTSRFKSYLSQHTFRQPEYSWDMASLVTIMDQQLLSFPQFHHQSTTGATSTSAISSSQPSLQQQPQQQQQLLLPSIRPLSACPIFQQISSDAKPATESKPSVDHSDDVMHNSHDNNDDDIDGDIVPIASNNTLIPSKQSPPVSTTPKPAFLRRLLTLPRTTEEAQAREKKDTEPSSVHHDKHHHPKSISNQIMLPFAIITSSLHPWMFTIPQTGLYWYYLYTQPPKFIEMISHVLLHRITTMIPIFQCLSSDNTVQNNNNQLNTAQFATSLEHNQIADQFNNLIQCFPFDTLHDPRHDTPTYPFFIKSKRNHKPPQTTSTTTTSVPTPTPSSVHSLSSKQRLILLLLFSIDTYRDLVSSSSSISPALHKDIPIRRTDTHSPSHSTAQSSQWIEQARAFNHLAISSNSSLVIPRLDIFASIFPHIACPLLPMFYSAFENDTMPLVAAYHRVVASLQCEREAKIMPSILLEQFPQLFPEDSHPRNSMNTSDLCEVISSRSTPAVSNYRQRHDEAPELAQNDHQSMHASEISHEASIASLTQHMHEAQINGILGNLTSSTDDSHSPMVSFRTASGGVDLTAWLRNNAKTSSRSTTETHSTAMFQDPSGEKMKSADFVRTSDNISDDSRFPTRRKIAQRNISSEQTIIDELGAKMNNLSMQGQSSESDLAQGFENSQSEGSSDDDDNADANKIDVKTVKQNKNRAKTNSAQALREASLDTLFQSLDGGHASDSDSSNNDDGDDDIQEESKVVPISSASFPSSTSRNLSPSHRSLISSLPCSPRRRKRTFIFKGSHKHPGDSDDQPSDDDDDSTDDHHASSSDQTSDDDESSDNEFAQLCSITLEKFYAAEDLHHNDHQHKNYTETSTQLLFDDLTSSLRQDLAKITPKKKNRTSTSPTSSKSHRTSHNTSRSQQQQQQSSSSTTLSLGPVESVTTTSAAVSGSRLPPKPAIKKTKFQQSSDSNSNNNQRSTGYSQRSVTFSSHVHKIKSNSRQQDQQDTIPPDTSISGGNSVASFRTPGAQALDKQQQQQQQQTQEQDPPGIVSSRPGLYNSSVTHNNQIIDDSINTEPNYAAHQFTSLADMLMYDTNVSSSKTTKSSTDAPSNSHLTTSLLPEKQSSFGLQGHLPLEEVDNPSLAQIYASAFNSSSSSTSNIFETNMTSMSDVADAAANQNTTLQWTSAVPLASSQAYLESTSEESDDDDGDDYDDHDIADTNSNTNNSNNQQEILQRFHTLLNRPFEINHGSVPESSTLSNDNDHITQTSVHFSQQHSTSTLPTTTPLGGQSQSRRHNIVIASDSDDDQVCDNSIAPQSSQQNLSQESPSRHVESDNIPMNQHTISIPMHALDDEHHELASYNQGTRIFQLGENQPHQDIIITQPQLHQSQRQLQLQHPNIQPAMDREALHRAYLLNQQKQANHNDEHEYDGEP